MDDSMNESIDMKVGTIERTISLEGSMIVASLREICRQIPNASPSYMASSELLTDMGHAPICSMISLRSFSTWSKSVFLI